MVYTILGASLAILVLAEDRSGVIGVVAEGTFTRRKLEATVVLNHENDLYRVAVSVQYSQAGQDGFAYRNIGRGGKVGLRWIRQGSSVRHGARALVGDCARWRRLSWLISRARW